MDSGSTYGRPRFPVYPAPSAKTGTKRSLIPPTDGFRWFSGSPRVFPEPFEVAAAACDVVHTPHFWSHPMETDPPPIHPSPRTEAWQPAGRRIDPDRRRSRKQTSSVFVVDSHPAGRRSCEIGEVFGSEVTGKTKSSSMFGDFGLKLWKKSPKLWATKTRPKKTEK